MRLFGRRSAAVTGRLDSHAAEACATLHAQAFAHPWDETDLEALLVAKDVEATGIWRSSTLLGFLLSRATGQEAEVLTLAVASGARRQGVGGKLLGGNLDALARRGVREVFLEVEESNRAALALYRRFRFTEVGRRPNYYRGADGGRADALILRHDMV